MNDQLSTNQSTPRLPLYSRNIDGRGHSRDYDNVRVGDRVIFGIWDDDTETYTGCLIGTVERIWKHVLRINGKNFSIHRVEGLHIVRDFELFNRHLAFRGVTYTEVKP